MRAHVTTPDGRRIELDDGLLEPFRAELATLVHAEPVRLAYAAAHLAMLPEYAALERTPERPSDSAEIAAHVDWPATLAFRRHLDAQGFGVAEAMDTAQRFEVGWPVAERLIRETGALGLAHGFCAGASADHLHDPHTKRDLVEGVVFQARTIQQAGGIPVILPLPELCAWRCDAADYVEVYGGIVAELDGPLLVHWLGEMFLPALRGYFPGDSFSAVMALDPAKVRGAKLSLLDAALELRVRAELARRDQIVLTGDDFHFARLVRGGMATGDAPAPEPERWTELAGRVALGDFSHALLGALDAVAVPAGLALRFLAHGRTDRWLALMDPCEALARHVFAQPTRHYKAGLAFLAWLNGHQPTPLLPNGADRARDSEHRLRLAELASRAGAIADAVTAAERLGLALD